jgi:hypothetical protein
MNRLLLAVTALALCFLFALRLTSVSVAIQPNPDAQVPPERSAAAEVSDDRNDGDHGDDVGSESTDKFEAQVKSWIESLSEQKEFESWRGAAWARYPLGPGMHGWLVLIMKNGQEIGYLVIGSAEDNRLKLIEYGTGGKPLFSLQTLYQSMVQHELIRSYDEWLARMYEHPAAPERLYYSPLHAVWKVASGNESIFIDAVTGEQLPLADETFLELEPLQADQSGLIADGARLTESLSLEPSDPFDDTSWITDEPLPIITPEQLVSAIGQQRPIIYAANLYGETVLAPFSSAGFHRWNEVLYAALAQEDALRYIPFPILAEYGSFFFGGK